jgi:hypothetical protein
VARGRPSRGRVLPARPPAAAGRQPSVLRRQHHVELSRRGLAIPSQADRAGTRNVFPMTKAVQRDAGTIWPGDVIVVELMCAQVNRGAPGPDIRVAALFVPE